MNFLFASILATQIQALPTCSSLLRRYEEKLAGWSASRRTVTELTEEHRYHRVTKQGVTVTIVLLAALPPEPAFPYRYGFREAEKCLMQGREATIFFKVLTK